LTLNNNNNNNHNTNKSGILKQTRGEVAENEFEVVLLDGVYQGLFKDPEEKVVSLLPHRAEKYQELTEDEVLENEMHTRARKIIEDNFGQFVHRFSAWSLAWRHGEKMFNCALLEMAALWNCGIHGKENDLDRQVTNHLFFREAIFTLEQAEAGSIIPSTEGRRLWGNKYSCTLSAERNPPERDTAASDIFVGIHHGKGVVVMLDGREEDIRTLFRRSPSQKETEVYAPFHCPIPLQDQIFEPLGTTIRSPILPFGACQFGIFADYLCSDEEKVPLLRNSVLKFVEQNPNMVPNLQNWSEEMRKPHTTGDEVSWTALVYICNVNAIVAEYTPETETTPFRWHEWVKYSPPPELIQKFGTPADFFFLQARGSHYCTLLKPSIKSPVVSKHYIVEPNINLVRLVKDDPNLIIPVFEVKTLGSAIIWPEKQVFLMTPLNPLKGIARPQGLGPGFDEWGYLTDGEWFIYCASHCNFPKKDLFWIHRCRQGLYLKTLGGDPCACMYVMDKITVTYGTTIIRVQLTVCFGMSLKIDN
jgi:hypothetical protein